MPEPSWIRSGELGNFKPLDQSLQQWGLDHFVIQAFSELERSFSCRSESGKSANKADRFFSRFSRSESSPSTEEPAPSCSSKTTAPASWPAPTCEELVHLKSPDLPAERSPSPAREASQPGETRPMCGAAVHLAWQSALCFVQACPTWLLVPVCGEAWGAKAVAKGGIWALTFDWLSGPEQDLLIPRLQDALISAAKANAFLAVGFAPICSSFSTANHSSDPE